MEEKEGPNVWKQVKHCDLCAMALIALYRERRLLISMGPGLSMAKSTTLGTSGRPCRLSINPPVASLPSPAPLFSSPVSSTVRGFRTTRHLAPRPRGGPKKKDGTRVDEPFLHRPPWIRTFLPPPPAGAPTKEQDEEGEKLGRARLKSKVKQRRVRWNKSLFAPRLYLNLLWEGRRESRGVFF